MTNFERLIVMGRADMEKLANQIAMYSDCENCLIYGECHQDDTEDLQGCNEVWLRWLQSEEKKGIKSIHETYADLECECNFLSEYITVLAIKSPQGEEAKKGTKAEIYTLCGSIINKVKCIQDLLIKEIEKEKE